MRIAAFEKEPDANATARMLRDRGYQTEVVTRGEKTYANNEREFFKGRKRTFEPRAFVVSGDAEYEPFMKAAQRHYGFVIRGETD